MVPSSLTYACPLINPLEFNQQVKLKVYSTENRLLCSTVAHKTPYLEGCTVSFNFNGCSGCAVVGALILGVEAPLCGESRRGIGDIVPEGGLGILRSSGEPGTIEAGR